jgi:uncharacterized protein YukE
MSRVGVELDQLAEFVDRLAAFEAHLARVRSEVDGRTQALHTIWTGAAASAQAAANAQWRAGAAEVHEALAALRTIAAGAHANYLAAVHANRTMWRTYC